jgi:hypothetical protein
VIVDEVVLGFDFFVCLIRCHVRVSIWLQSVTIWCMRWKKLDGFLREWTLRRGVGCRVFGEGMDPEVEEVRDTLAETCYGRGCFFFLLLE